jgi:hypothetical protein
MAWIHIFAKIIYIIIITGNLRIKQVFEMYNCTNILFRYILEGLTRVLTELRWLACPIICTMMKLWKDITVTFLCDVDLNKEKYNFLDKTKYFLPFVYGQVYTYVEKGLDDKQKYEYCLSEYCSKYMNIDRLEFSVVEHFLCAMFSAFIMICNLHFHFC